MMAEALKDYITPRQVAEHYKVPVHRVYSALKDGRLKGVKKGWGTLVDRNSLPKKWPGRE